MRTVVVSEPGGPEVLVVNEQPDPQPSARQVSIAVAAAGVNRADVMQRLGRYPAPDGEPDWPGLEVSGRITAIGSGVTHWSVGQEVCALLAGGGYADTVVVDERLVLPTPTSVDLVDAAALPEVACTVWSNVVMVAGLTKGETLLVHGGSSGIGTMAIQVAKALGARVAVTAGSAEKLERCRELGADILVNYREEDFVDAVRAATDGRGADVVLDTIGAKYLSGNVDVLARGGRIVTIGLLGGRKGELDLGKLLARQGSISATTLRSRSIEDKARIVAGVAEYVWPMIDDGRVRPVVDTRLPLEQAADAHRLMESSAHVGKILLLGR